MSDFGFWLCASVVVLVAGGVNSLDTYFEHELRVMCFEAGGFYQSDGSCVQKIPLE